MNEYYEYYALEQRYLECEKEQLEKTLYLRGINNSNNATKKPKEPRTLRGIYSRIKRKKIEHRRVHLSILQALQSKNSSIPIRRNGIMYQKKTIQL